MTSQDGLASIVPSPGSIQGPCDLLISIAAGASTAQIHLRVVAAASSSHPESTWEVSQISQLGVPNAMADTLLFAMPEALSGKPAADATVNSDLISHPEPSAVEAVGADSR